MTQTLHKLQIQFKLLKVTKDITWQFIFFLRIITSQTYMPETISNSTWVQWPRGRVIWVALCLIAWEKVRAFSSFLFWMVHPPPSMLLLNLFFLGKFFKFFLSFSLFLIHWLSTCNVPVSLQQIWFSVKPKRLSIWSKGKIKYNNLI